MPGGKTLFAFLFLFFFYLWFAGILVGRTRLMIAGLQCGTIRSKSKSTDSTVLLLSPVLMIMTMMMPFFSFHNNKPSDKSTTIIIIIVLLSCINQVFLLELSRWEALPPLRSFRATTLGTTLTLNCNCKQKCTKGTQIRTTVQFLPLKVSLLILWWWWWWWWRR